MHTSSRRLSRKLYLWSYRVWEDWREVEPASSDGEHVHCGYGDFTWHSDGGPTEWVEPVPTICNSVNPFKPW